MKSEHYALSKSRSGSVSGRGCLAGLVLSLAFSGYGAAAQQLPAMEEIVADLHSGQSAVQAGVTACKDGRYEQCGRLEAYLGLNDSGNQPISEWQYGIRSNGECRVADILQPDPFRIDIGIDISRLPGKPVCSSGSLSAGLELRRMDGTEEDGTFLVREWSCGLHECAFTASLGCYSELRKRHPGLEFCQ